MARTTKKTAEDREFSFAVNLFKRYAMKDWGLTPWQESLALDCPVFERILRVMFEHPVTDDERVEVAIPKEWPEGIRPLPITEYLIRNLKVLDYLSDQIGCHGRRRYLVADKGSWLLGPLSSDVGFEIGSNDDDPTAVRVLPEEYDDEGRETGEDPWTLFSDVCGFSSALIEHIYSPIPEGKYRVLVVRETADGRDEVATIDLWPGYFKVA